MAVAQDLLDEYLDHAVDLVGVEKDLQQRILGQLKALEQELISKFIDIDYDNPPTKAQAERMEKLLMQTKATIKSAYQSIESDHAEFLADFSKVEAEANVNLPNRILGASIFSTSLSPKQLKEICKDTLIQGAPSAEWWSRMDKKTMERFSDEVRQGMLAGEPLNEIVQRIRGKSTGKSKTYYQFIKGKDKDGNPVYRMKKKNGKPVRKKWMKFKGGVMGVTTREAESLARSSVQTVANTVRNQVIAENDEFVKGYEWMSTLDMRTTPLCRALDGNKWTLDYTPVGDSLPFPGPCPHWGCRSTTVPWMKPMSELSQGKLGDIPEGKRAAMADSWPDHGGDVPSKTTFTQWFDKQPEERQLEILGPGKLSLYKKNKLTFRDMVDGNGEPLTIPELEAKVKKKGFKPLPPRVPEFDEQGYLRDMKQALEDPEVTVQFRKNIDHGSLSLNGVRLKKAGPPRLGQDIDIGEPKFKATKGKKTSSGIIIEEDDGRVWVYEPEDHFGGYEHTFPKGTINEGETLQQAAIREVFEETGLEVEITGFLGDYEKSTSKTRYYVGRRKGGDPSAAHWEAKNVKLVPKQQVKDLLNVDVDKNIVDDYFNGFHASDKYLEFEPGSQRGSNPGGTFTHKLTGKKFYGKFYSDIDQARSEVLANNLAGELDIGAPKSKIATVAVPKEMQSRLGAGQADIILTDFVDDLKALEYKKKSKRLQAQIAKHHIFAGLVEDWDVVGLGYDNLLMDGSGRVFVIDQGGAFKFRAQGLPKKYSELPDAFDSLLTDINHQAKTVFGPVFESYTKENGEQLARWLGKLSDNKIRRSALAAGIQDTQLVENLISRKKVLIDRLRSFKKSVEVINKPDKIGRHFNAIEGIKKSRIVGKNIKGDRDLVEDCNMLFWEEKNASGEIITRVKMKMTLDGSNRITDSLDLRGQISTGPVNSRDMYWNDILSFIKTVNHHAGDGKYNTDTVSKALEWKKSLTELACIAAEAETKAMARHYVDLIERVEKAMAQGKTTGQLKQFTPKPRAVRPRERRSAARVRKRKIEFAEKQTERGRSRSTGSHVYKKDDDLFEIDFDDGIKVDFVPYNPNDPFSRNDSMFALRGQIDGYIDGEVTQEKLNDFFDHMASIGVDLGTPSDEFLELLYLKQGAYINNWDLDSGFQEIWNAQISDAEKIGKIKSHIKKKYAIMLPEDNYPDWYNPIGQENSFGEGWNRRHRWDLPVEEVEKEMKSYTLYHSPSGSIPDLIESLLNGGGDFTSTTERLRKGVSIRAGWSPEPDIRSGGANYLFTRIRSKRNRDTGLRFKIRNLSRVDAITYRGDMYGRTTGDTVRELRGRTVKDFKDYSGSSSNETIFKYGLNVLDELESITVASAAEKKKVVDLFMKHGWERLPDGRKVEDIIKVR